MDEDKFIELWNEMAKEVHKNAVQKGFWEHERNVGEMIALMHSELSEALEGIREGNKQSEKLGPGFNQAEEEFADLIIRVMDTCYRRGWKVAGAIIAKHLYNQTRPYKHGKKF